MSSRPALQFSLTALFILTTLLALALSAFFAISRFFGVSPGEVLLVGFGSAVFLVPRFIVWAVGLSMALRRLPTYPRPAKFAVIGLIGFMVTALLAQTIQMVVITSMRGGQVGAASVGWLLSVNAVFHAILDLGCWCFILAAIFAGRPVDPARYGSPTGGMDPFNRDEALRPAIVEDDQPLFE